MSDRPLVFLDLETTGLDPYKHRVWEIAYAVEDYMAYPKARASHRHDRSPYTRTTSAISSFVVPHNLLHADPVALKINGYVDRAVSFDISVEESEALEQVLYDALANATVVAANPAFDTAFLRERWRGRENPAPWHHRLLDIEAYGAGVLGLSYVPSLFELRERLTDMGYGAFTTPDHTAYNDCKLVIELHNALRNITAERAQEVD